MDGCLNKMHCSFGRTNRQGQALLECYTPQCRVNRINALVSQDFPDLHSPALVLAGDVIGGEGFFFNTDLVYIDTEGQTDLQIRLTIFHERLHADEAFHRGEFHFSVYGLAEASRHRPFGDDHDPDITALEAQYHGYLDGVLDFQGNPLTPFPDLSTLPWRNLNEMNVYDSDEFETIE